MATRTRSSEDRPQERNQQERNREDREHDRELAAGDGRIKARGTSKGAGNFIKLVHTGDFESLYLHLDSFAPGTEVGDVVAQHQVIARSGNTGRSTGPHVHYELHIAGEALDPADDAHPRGSARSPRSATAQGVHQEPASNGDDR